MSNELTKYLSDASLPTISDEDMADAIETVSDEMGGGNDGVQYLSFSGKTDTYSLGRNKAQIDPDQLFIMEPQSLVTGWVCWKGSKPISRVEWSIYRKGDGVQEHELEDHGPYRADSGDGWNAMFGFGCIECSALKTQVKFSTTSKSGRNAVEDFMGEVRKRILAKEPTMPVFVFDSASFVANEQTNFKPVFEVEAWVTRVAAAAYFSGEMELDDLLAGEEPKKKKRAAATSKTRRNR